MANEVSTKGTKITAMNGQILGWLDDSAMKRINTKLMIGGSVGWAGEITISKAAFELSQHSQHITRGCKIDGIKGICKFSVFLTKAELEKATDYFIKHIVVEKV